MYISDCISIEDVASSNIINGVFFRIALTMDRRCFCPPDKLIPFFPISVLKPFGKDSIKESELDIFTEFITSTFFISLSQPYSILFRIVSLNKNTSCDTTDIFDLID